jgi:hypothetical protein
MKKFVAVATAILALALAGPVMAQTNVTSTGAITASQAADIIASGIEGNATNWVVAADGIYAPHAEKDGHFGAVLMLGYKVSDYVVIGLHGEYLDGLPTYGGGQLTLQLPFHPVPKLFPTVTATPWAFVGSGTSFGNGKAVTVVGETAAGLAVGLWKSPHGTYSIGLNAGVGKRTDIKDEVYIGGADAQVNF